MMSAKDAAKIASRIETGGFDFWLDGGWGVDALIGEQTRDHDDIDVVVRLEETDRLIAWLEDAGFSVVTDDRPTRFVMTDTGELRIDFHPIVFDQEGNARQIGAGLNGGDAPYPAWGFDGEGSIAGRPVPCLSPRLLVLHHTGYEPHAKDRHNVTVLCQCFGLPPPPGYD
jgi:lincosamide nucleotidyltransferase A/C/D/E